MVNSHFFKNIRKRFGFSYKKPKKDYIDAEIINEVKKIVLMCSNCGQKLRLPVLPHKKLRVSCFKCKNEFVFDCEKYRKKQQFFQFCQVLALIAMVSIDGVTPIFLFLKKDILGHHIQGQYEMLLKKMRIDFEREKIVLEHNYTEELKAVNIDSLRLFAERYYAKVFSERRNFNSRYALSPREKAQLEMFALSKDNTKSIEYIIESIASKAAPKNSIINVSSSGDGYGLDIDFDMSELSIGEKGSSTKHNSIDSLKKDVNRLVAKVTNDVYQFCQSIDLDFMSIGCRHYVRKYGTGKVYQGEENEVIYKITLEKKDLGELRGNPFLDRYATSKYFKVVKDEFPNLEISETKL